jgi:hypothetical protein
MKIEIRDDIAVWLLREWKWRLMRGDIPPPYPVMMADIWDQIQSQLEIDEVLFYDIENLR